MSKMRVTNTIVRSVNTSSQQSTATDANTEYVRIMSDTNGVHIAFGASPTATTSSMYIPANDIEIIKIRPGEKVAFIGSGDLYVTELSG